MYLGGCSYRPTRLICVGTALLSSEILGLKPKIIIAYGLGSFVTSQEACRQLALCQLLGQFLSVQKVSGFDPIWSAADKRVFSRLGFECETHNDVSCTFAL
jgi:hypothetical protein